MLNRNAEALFWVGRYTERAENHARLIDVHYHIQQEGDASPLALKWSRIVDALGSLAAYEQQYGAFTERDVLAYMTLEKNNPNSLLSCVNNARSNIRTLREKVPSELWDVLSAFYLWLKEQEVEDIVGESPHLFYKRIKEWTGLFHGVQQSVMLRENEWHLIECGRYLERAENTLRIIRSVHRAAEEDGAAAYSYLLAVLKSVSGYQAFRRYYADAVSIEAIVDFLIRGAAFPRSVRFAFRELDGHLRGVVLQDGAADHPQDKAIRLAAKANADLACLDKEDMRSDNVGAVLQGMLASCEQLGTAIAKTFFRIGEASA